MSSLGYLLSSAKQDYAFSVPLSEKKKKKRRNPLVEQWV